MNPVYLPNPPTAGISGISPYNSDSPVCAKCRNHGIRKSESGHEQFCPFRKCVCVKCLLTTNRQKIREMKEGKSTSARHEGASNEQILDESHHSDSSMDSDDYALHSNNSMDFHNYSDFNSYMQTRLGSLTLPLYDKIAARRQTDRCVQTVSYWSIDELHGNLSNDFLKLLDTGLNHDVEIKCRDCSIKVHKIILCARSDVFKAMLSGSMVEGRTGAVEIHDIDIDCLQDFVRYLYTDELPNLTFDKAQILYETGDKYAVKSLMHRCVEYFQENLSPENAFQCLALADLHSDQKLEDAVVLYFYEKKLFLEEFWLSVSENCPRISAMVCKFIYEHANTGKENKYTQTESHWNVDKSRGSLSQDLSNLLDTAMNYDVEVKCEDRLIKAHKIVLCARSDVFKTMIQRAMLQGQTNILEVPLRYFEYFMQYLYSDTLPVLSPHTAALLYADGSTYVLTNLQRRCIKYLQENSSE